jgi:hypothetical protein
MRRLLAAVTAIASLALAASALAVLPKGGKTYKGTAAVPKLVNFKDPVSFVTRQGGHRVEQLKVGYLTCRPYGGPEPSTNPYTQPDNVIEFGRMGVGGDGSFTGSGYHIANGVRTDGSVTGKFKKRKKRVIATGTLKFTQTFSGGKCGPQKVKFTAKPK